MPRRPQRFFSLDVLRGFAALTVVFWHWQHFFLFGGPVPPTTAQPLHGVFYLFYGAGWMAVDLFFSLSGFIFFWLYADAITDRRVSARDFFVLRMSRLYPLHLATLLAVALGQRVFLHLTKGYFIFAFNDRYHFLLNLGMIQAWGFERYFSFNAPEWSVSIEVALYLMFFVLCRLMRARLLPVAALSALGFLVVTRFNPLIGKGMGGFFVGGCVYFLYERIVAKGYDRVLARVLPVILLAAWASVVAGPGQRLRLGLMPWRSEYIDDYWPMVVLLFPLTILTLVLVETRRGTLGRRVAFIGDLSYSSYLLHFPLQLAVATVTVFFAIDRAIFFSPMVLLAFFAVLIAASLASYTCFEAPAQRWLRARLVRRGAGAGVAAATTRASGSGDSGDAAGAGSP